MSLAQQVLLAVCPKVTATLSLAGSSIVARQVSRKRGRGEDNNSKRIRSYRSLVLGMSAADIISSVAWFCSSWPIPRTSPDSVAGYDDMFGAVGTQETCSLQGFLGTLSLTAVLYNSLLALYYFLVIAKGWGEARIQRILPYLHAIAMVYGLAICVAGAAMRMFNSVGWACWIAAYPPGCVESWRAALSGVSPTCTRGDNATLFLWGAYFGPLWLAIAFCTVTMSLVYSSVRRIEKKNVKYTRGWETSNRQDQDSKSKGSRRGSVRSITRSLSEDLVEDRRGSISRASFALGCDANGAIVTEGTFPRFTLCMRRNASWGGTSMKDPYERAPKRLSELLERNKKNATRSTPFALRRESSRGNISVDANASVVRQADAYKRSRKVANQASLFVGFLYLTWIFPTLQSLMYTISAKQNFYLVFLQASIMPLQGCFNCFMYFRPLYIRSRKHYTSISALRVIWLVLAGYGDNHLKREHKRNAKIRRKKQLEQERRRLRNNEPSSPGARVFPFSYFKPRNHGMKKSPSLVSKASFDPSVELGGSEQSTSNQSRHRREKIISNWQRNYNNLPGRHQMGCKSAPSRPLDVEEDRTLWQENV